MWSVSASSRIGREIDPSWSSTSRTHPTTITFPRTFPVGDDRSVVDGGGSAGYLGAFIEPRGHAAGVP